MDDVWTTDHEAPKEDDGHHNVNNILLPENIKKTTIPTADSVKGTGASTGFASSAGGLAAGAAGAAMLSGVTPQSTTANLAGQVPKENETTTNDPSTAVETEEHGDKLGGDDFSGDNRATTIPADSKQATPGAFPETPAEETSDFAVKPIPASEGIGNPVSVAAGEKLPDQSTLNSNTVDSTATTSKEGYEKDASATLPAAATAAGVGAYEHEKKPEADSFGVNPIPASSGIGNPISVPAGEKLPEQSSFNPNTVESTATTSKEAYEKDDVDSFGVKPIPASAGIGNPISIPAGEKLPEQSTFNPTSVDSTATTSKEGYERDASAPLVASGAATGIGEAGLAQSKQESTSDSAFSVPEKSNNLIPESSLPMGGEAKDTVDSGPFIQSAAPKSSSYYLASTVPFEPKREAKVIDDDEAPSATLSGPAPGIPEVVKESLTEAHQSPEAAASVEAVQEKSAVENELLSEVKKTDAIGEPEPSAISGTTGVGSEPASSVPETVRESILKSHESPEAAVSPEVVNEKSAVENELLQEVKRTDATGEPQPSAATGVTGIGSEAASSVPATVKESILKSNESPEAAASAKVVDEKTAVESELLNKVKSTDEAGEPAPTAAAATGETAPAPTGGSSLGAPTAGAAVGTLGATLAPSQKGHAPRFTPATPGIEIVNPIENAPHSRPATSAQAEPTIPEERAEERDPNPTSTDPNASATTATTTTTSATPTKKTPASAAAGTTPTSAASSPASTATKEQKKKNRRSFFGKLKDKLKDL